ncbi:NADPH-dependent FMN reductase [Synechococcales cyanobacterium C]|uniref:NADPH-dependent FMN reductase n=1 Tax=Petrachloros mirabilis ULC683 TaxID=2781853 RepID=A0A8K1ZX97_9CYAN|nr:NADPH-dependent FMN reductase [Petrachloros mirabilis]NCJ06869.1 NADPH-dependent FMN reductase [Petrachloros mirabilis ULC683]
MIKIVGFSGSLRPTSYSRQALHLAGQKAEALGAAVTLLDLRDLDLPFCDGTDELDQHPGVIKLRQSVEAADGLILVTPEYHGAVSGVLKNALDLLSFEHLSGKVTGAISVLGGQANSNALNQLRLITRWVHAWMIPEQVAIGQAWNAFDDEERLKDEKLDQRLTQFVENLVRAAGTLSQRA